jgi:photosystem II stability/assembly factor-like uncharacterized protein
MVKNLLVGFFIFSFFFCQGQFWTESYSGFTTDLTGLSKFHIVDDNVAWAVAYDGVNTANNIQQFAKTTDGGATWTTGSFNIGNPNLGIANVVATSDLVAYVAAYPMASSQQGGVWKTTDGGVTWARQNGAAFTSATSFTNLVHFFDPSSGVVVGDPTNGFWEIYVTSNGGNSYTRLPSSNIPAAQANETGYLAQYAFSGDHIWFTTSTGRIVRSSDKGITWSVSQSPLTDFGGTMISGDLSFATATRGVIQDNAGNIYKSTDAGQTWNNVVLSGVGAPYGGAISYLPGTFHMVSTGGDASFSGSSYSVDDGITWTNVDTEQHVDCVFFNETTGYSGGFSNSLTNEGVYRYTSTVLSNEDVALKNKIRLFPNPVKDQFQITTDQNFKSVTIVDLYGRIVRTSEEQVVTTQLLTPGIYIAQITTDLGRTNIRFIKQ